MLFLKSMGIALIASLFCIYLLRPLGMRVGFVDHPNERKWHKEAIPLIGGIAMFFGFCFALLGLNISLETTRGIIAGSALLILMGTIDDFNGLNPLLRLGGQLIAAILLIKWSPVSLQHLGNLFFLGDIQVGTWSTPLTLLLVLSNINAMNMIDGQDGLAGGVALGQASLLLFLAVLFHILIVIYLLAILIAVLLVFLSFNVHWPWQKRASIFMGDSGSTFIAFLLAYFSIQLSQCDSSIVKPITLLWIMSFPLFDLIMVILVRIRKGKSIVLAGQDHIHHALHLLGLRTMISTGLLCAFSLLLGVIGLIFHYYQISESYQFLLWVLSLLFYMLIVEQVRKPIARKKTEIVYGEEH